MLVNGKGPSGGGIEDGKGFGAGGGGHSNGNESEGFSGVIILEFVE